jgi:hypothetical protein
LLASCWWLRKVGHPSPNQCSPQSTLAFDMSRVPGLEVNPSIDTVNRSGRAMDIRRLAEDCIDRVRQVTERIVG